MKTFAVSHVFRLLALVLVLLATTFFAPAAADEPRPTMPDPGYRPDSEQSGLFLDSVGDTSFAVLPTMIHRLERTAHSFDSQQLIIDFLNENRIGQATGMPLRIDRGTLERRTQWDLFQRGINTVAAALSSQEPAADYTLVMEILVPGDQAVFGVHVYILDQQRRSAFSFLLNAHHQLFAEAGLVASDTSEEARAKMIARATHAGLQALQAQIMIALECAQRSPIVSEPSLKGIQHDFETPPLTGTDELGIRIGYSTFAGPDSRVDYRVVNSYPARDIASPGNGALRIDLDVDSWGGVINRFANASVDQWHPQDWRELEGFSFWFHGENSGAPVFFDVFDNRGECSGTDDAERFRYRFMDDVAGWRQVRVRFADLERWDVGNNSPNDGFGLDRIHGWGIGTSNSEGPVKTTFYFDDFRLLSELPDAFAESPRLLAHGVITELRIDEVTSRVETTTHDDGRLVAYQVVDLMCACVRLARDRGYSYFRIDERETLNGDRARFRLTFYGAPPADHPVLDIPAPGSDEPIAFSMSAAIPVDRMLIMCQPGDTVN